MSNSAEIQEELKKQLQADVVTAQPLDVAQRCRYCKEYNNQEALFQPCHCAAIHRDCFRKWRQGWINPRNYFSCPDCMYSYRIERVRESTTESKQRINRRYRLRVLLLWLGTLTFFCGFIGIVASIAYLCDRSEKNIPVALKYMLTSVVNGLPNKNSTTLWMEDFKKPEVAVWPYYTLFGAFISCICILIGFACIGCTFDETERRRGRPCCADCNETGPCYCYCYDPCPHENCCCTGGSSSDCSCSDCNCKGSDCKCDGGGGGGGEAIIIIALVVILVIIVVVIVSAVFVVIFYAIKKWTLLYDRMTDMLLQQQAELEGETVVLAMNENWRPDDSV